MLCVVELYECITTEEAVMRRGISNEEIALGNYVEGRFAWLTRNLRRLKNPVPVKGAQGFFNLPTQTAQRVLMEIE